jgi:pimeloyl-ACP methyl ester carboxylesterase
MSTIIVSGEKLHYTAHKGDPGEHRPSLLLIHGAGGTLMHWPAELRRLASCDVYALDLPGHGGSGGQGRSDVSAYAETVRDFAQALRLRPFVLVGHSMGGAIALELALQSSVRLAGLVLVGTGARLRVAPEILGGILDDFDATARLLAEWSHAGQVPPALLDIYVRRLRAVPLAVIHDDFLACNRFDRLADVCHIAVPTLIICGADDRMTPVKYSRYLAEQIPGAGLVIVPGGGHMALLEPGSTHAVVEPIREFLGSLSSLLPTVQNLSA